MAGKIVLAAWDDLRMVADAVSTSWTGIGQPRVDAHNYLGRQNEVTLSGTAGMARSLDIYVGRKADGDTAGIPGVYTYAYGYNEDHSLGVTEKPKVTSTVFDQNAINVKQGSYGELGETKVTFKP